jgi:PAS domain S-box-containing protein
MSVAQRHGPFRRRLSPQPPSVGEARRLVREAISESEHESLAERAVLLVSEVVTNALLHAGTPIDLAATVDPRGIRVEVHDGSPHLPVRRRYGPTAGTGRGLMMLEEMADDWGVSPEESGKTVWFEILAEGAAISPATGNPAAAPSTRAHTRTVSVTLNDMPLLLHAAWREHAEALLREHLLASLEREGAEDPIRVHAEATDAMAVIDEQIPRLDVAVEPDRLMNDATEPRVSASTVRVEVPAASVPNFALLDRTIEAALEMAGDGLVLAPPTQPEIRDFRRWLCGQVTAQAAGGRAVPWRVRASDGGGVDDLHVDWDTATVARAATATVAADEANRIIAVSPAALELLGYDGPDDLVGSRIVAIVPERFRQAHIAGFTMYLLVGRKPLLERPVQVPALRRDGTETDVEMTVRVERVGEGRKVFVATLRPVG